MIAGTYIVITYQQNFGTAIIIIDILLNYCTWFGPYLAFINQAEGLYGRTLAEVVSTECTKRGL